VTVHVSVAERDGFVLIELVERQVTVRAVAGWGLAAGECEAAILVAFVVEEDDSR
jgi:hypothetical protein